MPDYNKFFTVIGQFNTETEHSFRYYPLFLKKRELDFQEIMETESEMYALLLNERGETFLKVPLSHGHYCTGKESLPQMAVRGYIPFDEHTRSLQFRYKSKTIEEFKIPPHKPQINEVTNLPAKIDGETLELKWNTVYEGDTPLQYKVFYSNDAGKTWQGVGNRTSQPHMRIDITNLSGGEKCRFAVQVTDGYNNSRIETNDFSTPNKPAEAIILSPLEGAVSLSTRDILLNGQGYDPNTDKEITDGILWSSSIDGNLGKGPLVQTKLSKGKHTISLYIGKSVNKVNIKVE